MKKLLTLTVAVLVAIPAVALANGELEGEADLDSIGGSGVTAEIEFEDDGSTVTIEGEAEGLTPGKTYVSLIYDNGSVAMPDELACVPTILGGPGSILDRMFVGFWEVDADGDGELTATNFSNEPGDSTVYVPLDDFHTISIREIVSFEPLVDVLVACGVEITEDDDEEDDD